MNIAVTHGTCWSAEQYAALILQPNNQSSNGPTESPASAAISAYAAALRTSGVHEVANGFILCGLSTDSGTESSKKLSGKSGCVYCTVVRGEDEIWQAAASLAEPAGAMERTLS